MIETIGLTMGVIGGLIATGVCLALGVIAALIGRAYWRSEARYFQGAAKKLPPLYDGPTRTWDMDRSERVTFFEGKAADAKKVSRLMWLIPAGVLVFAGLMWALSAIPYRATYLQSYAVTGTVESVSDQFVSGTGDASYGERVVTVAGLPQAFIVDNPRILAFHTGDSIALTCEVGWVYRNSDRWTCDLRGGN